VLELLVIMFFVFLCLNSWPSMLRGCPTLVLNSWSSCSWCSYSSAQYLIIMFFCDSTLVLPSSSLCYLQLYSCAWAFGCCVIIGLTWVLELLVIMFFMVLP
jgi:hypothetical protein